MVAGVDIPCFVAISGDGIFNDRDDRFVHHEWPVIGHLKVESKVLNPEFFQFIQVDGPFKGYRRVFDFVAVLDRLSVF